MKRIVWAFILVTFPIFVQSQQLSLELDAYAYSFYSQNSSAEHVAPELSALLSINVKRVKISLGYENLFCLYHNDGNIFCVTNKSVFANVGVNLFTIRNKIGMGIGTGIMGRRTYAETSTWGDGEQMCNLIFNFSFSYRINERFAINVIPYIKYPLESRSFVYNSAMWNQYGNKIKVPPSAVLGGDFGSKIGVEYFFGSTKTPKQE